MKNILFHAIVLCLTVSVFSVNPALVPGDTPTRALPDPLPPITMAANPDQIAAFTGGDVSPWGGVFDSQGRYIFFDQKVKVSFSTKGSNQLIRMTGFGASPAFETIATQAQLGAADARWSDPDYWPELVNLDILSDGSIVMIGFGMGAEYNPQKLLKITPGNPPQISVIASFETEHIYAVEIIQRFAVDRSQNPNKIYLVINGDIYTVFSNQSNATPSLWMELGDWALENLVIDNLGNLIYCESGGYIKKIDKNTKAVSTISQQSLKDSLEGDYSSTVAFVIDQTTGNIFGQYHGSYPDSGYRNLFKATKNMSGLYEAVDFATENQVLEDPDIEPYWLEGLTNFVISGLGLAVDPAGNYFFCSSGSNSCSGSHMCIQGIDSIVKIGTEAKSSARNALWCYYE